ncbi:SLAM family member 5 [Odontesthes bonariensis]|uniref:SLAM family member 5 n=1 Tax=Odontesthes bonariensis TaxID=219752 RepID=UPI003F58F765
MNPLILVVSCIHFQVLVNSLEISEYVGGTVTLPSGAKSSWNLSRIDWSIFANSTWIATYQNGRTNTQRLPRYGDRLRLNITSGDLTIRNLKIEDAMEYNVDLVNTDNEDRANKIKLTVKQRLQVPTTQKVYSAATETGCFMVLKCSSSDEGVTLSWQVNPPNVHTLSSPEGRPSLLFADIRNTQDSVQFTCTSSRRMENASRVLMPKCDVPEKPTPSRDRSFVCFFFGGFLGGFITVIIIYCFGDHIKKAWQSLREKLCQREN